MGQGIVNAKINRCKIPWFFCGFCSDSPLQKCSTTAISR